MTLVRWLVVVEYELEYLGNISYSLFIAATCLSKERLLTTNGFILWKYSVRKMCRKVYGSVGPFEMVS